MGQPRHTRRGVKGGGKSFTHQPPLPQPREHCPERDASSGAVWGSEPLTSLWTPAPATPASKPTALPHASSPPSRQDSYGGPPVSCGPRVPTSPRRTRPHVGSWESRHLTSPRKGWDPGARPLGTCTAEGRQSQPGQAPVSVHQTRNHTRPHSPGPQEGPTLGTSQSLHPRDRLAPDWLPSTRVRLKCSDPAAPQAHSDAGSRPPGHQAGHHSLASRPAPAIPAPTTTQDLVSPVHPRFRPPTCTHVPGPSRQNVVTCMLVPQVLRKETSGSRCRVGGTC